MTTVLTCRPCNNEAGERLEGELKKRRVVEDFAGRRLTVPVWVNLEVADGTRSQAQAAFNADGTLEIAGVGAATNPDDFAATQSWWERQAREGTTDFQFSIHLPAYHHTRSQAALVKAAYLVGFAAFGYTYILRQQLDRVREGIRTADEDRTQRRPVITAPDQDPRVHRILLATQPLRALCIEIGKDFVLLPWLDSPPDFWRSIEGFPASGAVTASFEAAGDWPRFPEYRLDRPVTSSDGRPCARAAHLGLGEYGEAALNRVNPWALRSHCDPDLQHGTDDDRVLRAPFRRHHRLAHHQRE